MEASNSATSQQLSEREVEAERLSKEFDNYKLRAQSVLKQSKDQQVKVNFETFIAERILQPLESFKIPHPCTKRPSLHSLITLLKRGCRGRCARLVGGSKCPTTD